MHTSCVCAVDNKISVLLINHADSVFCKNKKTKGNKKQQQQKHLYLEWFVFFFCSKPMSPTFISLISSVNCNPQYLIGMVLIDSMVDSTRMTSICFLNKASVKGTNLLKFYVCICAFCFVLYLYLDKFCRYLSWVVYKWEEFWNVYVLMTASSS